MARESSKAKPRRESDPQYGFLWSGVGIDIGCGDDPVSSECAQWDWADGDAQLMSGVEVGTFDWVYSSHCLEHVSDPQAALARWWELLRPGGKLLVVVPDEDLYEQGVWPSRFNLDHKQTFTPHKSNSWSPVSVNLMSLVGQLPDHKVHWCRLIDSGYEHGDEVWDRTLGAAEANIELMVEKLSGPNGQENHLQRFRHSGKLGDIIYSLPAVQVLGGGVMSLRPNRELGLSPEGCVALEPLLLAQPYIAACECWDGEPVTHDLDLFRSMDPSRVNLAECHLSAFGLDPALRDSPWLVTPQRIAIKDYPVVLSLSLRRSGVPGFWQAVYKLVGSQSVFLGTGEEHAAFEEHVGKVQYCQTETLLDAAEIIAGSDLFVGNQSALLAIAEGLKVSLIQETDPAAPNCVFSRPGASCVDGKWAKLLEAYLDGSIGDLEMACVFPEGRHQFVQT